MKRSRIVAVCFVALLWVFNSCKKANVNEPELAQKPVSAETGRKDLNTIEVPYLPVFQREIPKNVFWVTRTKASRDTIFSWFYRDGYEDPVKEFRGNDILSVKDGTFDASKYFLSDTMRRAIQDAKGLAWLKIKIESPKELDWISELTELEGFYLDSQGLKALNIEKLKSLVNLKFLAINGTLSGKLPKLSQLEFLNAELDDSQIPYAGQYPDLTGLYFRWQSKVTNDGILRLVNSNPNLRHLSLANLKFITSECMEHVFKFSELEYLHIGTTELERYRREIQTNLPSCYIAVGS